jgi:hypothetical protein
MSIDEIIEDGKEGIFINVSQKNLEFLASEDKELYIKYVESIYRRQLIFSHGFKQSEYEDIIKEKNE